VSAEDNLAWIYSDDVDEVVDVGCCAGSDEGGLGTTISDVAGRDGVQVLGVGGEAPRDASDTVGEKGDGGRTVRPVDMEVNHSTVERVD
jgi:hypothetical protein